jgi:hypothetical protein
MTGSGSAITFAPRQVLHSPRSGGCSPHRAYDRLISKRGGLGGLEHHGAAGSTRGRDAYMDLQTRLVDVFEELVAPWRCVVVSADDEEEDSSVKRARVSGNHHRLTGAVGCRAMHPAVPPPGTSGAVGNNHSSQCELDRVPEHDPRT